MSVVILVLLVAGAGLPLLLMPARITLRGNTREARLASRVHSLLPQTQCRECGFPGCLPYARAVAAGTADIDRCPPGGHGVYRQLAELMGREAADPGPQPAPARIARIVEADCIGCVKCIPACPVDAIVGAPGQLHAIIERECTGCGLCIAPCPVDCIILAPAQGAAWTWPRPGIPCPP